MRQGGFIYLLFIASYRNEGFYFFPAKEWCSIFLFQYGFSYMFVYEHMYVCIYLSI